MYKNDAAKAMQSVWDLLQRKDWKLEKSKGSDTVHTTTVPNIGKVFKMTVHIQFMFL